MPTPWLTSRPIACAISTIGRWPRESRADPSLGLTFIAGEPWPGQLALADLAASARVAEGDIDGLAPPADDVALMLLSGGTTGVPKFIPRTHNDYVRRFKSEVQQCSIDGMAE